MQCKVVSDKDDILKCIKLGETHYNEVEKRFTGLPFTPKYDLFLELFEKGLLHTIALYDGVEVEGYLMFVTSPSLFSNSVNAQEIGLFVNSKHRGSGWFKRMLELAEEELKTKGATILLLAFKEGMQHRLPQGFKEAETFYIKSLELQWQ